MEIKDQVTSLELSKKLKELGVKQDSLFYWIKTDSIKNKEYIISHYKFSENGFSDTCLEKETSYINGASLESTGCGCCGISSKISEIYSAFTASELGEMLPYGFDSYKRSKNDFICRLFVHISFSKTEQDARAKMLIYLIENNKIDIKND